MSIVIRTKIEIERKADSTNVGFNKQEKKEMTTIVPFLLAIDDVSYAYPFMNEDETVSETETKVVFKNENSVLILMPFAEFDSYFLGAVKPIY